MTPARQSGYLMIVAIILIIIIGFLGLSVAYMVAGSASSTLNAVQGSRALYLAESGFEQAARQLLTATLSNRIACSGLSISNTLGAGAYSTTATGPFAVTSPTTLSSAITATATTIPVTSTATYQSSGRIRIDNEFINYAAVDGTNFIGLTRGVDGSLASSHTSGTRVGQYQCHLSSQGGVPSLSPPSNTPGGKRMLAEAIQLEDGFAAGTNLSGALWNVAHWNIPTEKSWTQQTISAASPQILTGVSILSNVDAWIVGRKASALRYNGNTWTLTNTGTAGGDNLTSVSAVSSQEVWACADQGKVYKWTGGSWTNPYTPGDNPNSISMLDTNGNGTADTGWVVGAKKSASLYNGTSWASAATGITADLFSVCTLSATDAWAAGKAAIFQWNGSSWSGTSPTAATLNSISMIRSGASDIGWAVGTASTALYYNGSSWSSAATGLPAALTLNGVVTVSSREAWLVDSSGHIYEWNGSTWTLVFTSAAALSAIDMLHPNSNPQSAWTESFA